MKRIRARGEEIRQFILDQCEAHPLDIAKLAAVQFQVSRQAINKHLQKLTAEGRLKEAGRTRSRSYQLAPLAEWQRQYEIPAQPQDDLVWTQEVRPALGSLPDNVTNIWQTVFTEMFNNAIEHSSGRRVAVSLRKTVAWAEMDIKDDGVGVFAKIREALDLPDEQHAVLELSKGKLTTDPGNHTGEGIFFSARMVDSFVIASGKEFFAHEYGQGVNRIPGPDNRIRKGTLVSMRLGNLSSRTTRQIYDEFASGEDFRFDKTVVPVRLARFGTDALVSRSQARRVLARVDQFKVVMLDFAGVDAIGQAFADELFRVFARQHPEIEFQTTNANAEVASMIARAKAGLKESST